jgi:hypothetical protein
VNLGSWPFPEPFESCFLVPEVKFCAQNEKSQTIVANLTELRTQPVAKYTHCKLSNRALITLAPPDVDNIIKPILDALESVVIINDQQVRRVCCEKFDLAGEATIQDPEPLLATALEKYDELLHIIVSWQVED